MNVVTELLKRGANVDAATKVRKIELMDICRERKNHSTTYINIASIFFLMIYQHMNCHMYQLFQGMLGNQCEAKLIKPH